MATGTLILSLLARPAGRARRPPLACAGAVAARKHLAASRKQRLVHGGGGPPSSGGGTKAEEEEEEEERPWANPTDRRPLVISGPSGVGKGTLYNMLFERHPDAFCLAVSHTTRPPRPGEVDGKHYHFVTADEFEALVARDGFVEHARFGGNRYGTSKGTIEEQTRKGRIVLLDIEMEGVKQIKRSGMAARFVFIAPPSIAQLEARLRGRGTESEASVQKRLAQASNELEYSHTPDVHDLIIVNDDLEAAYRELEQFIFKPVDS